VGNQATQDTTELRFLTWEERRQHGDDLECRVMAFEPKGQYPRGTWYVPNGFFHADERVVFSVVLGESWQTLDPDMPYSEFDWASPQELRLWASLILCEVMDGPRTSFYPIVEFSGRLDATNFVLQSSETVAMVRSLLLLHISPAATSKSPTCGQVKFPHLTAAGRGDDYARVACLATFSAASLSR